jgi:hypothetical protein
MLWHHFPEPRGMFMMPAYSERRQTVRIATNGNMTVECLSPGPSLWLEDVGMGGFCARSGSQIPVDTIASYRFATADRKWTAIFRAKTVHCRPESRDGKSTNSFINGFCFVNVESAAVQSQLCALLDQAMNYVSFS